MIKTIKFKREVSPGGKEIFIHESNSNIRKNLLSLFKEGKITKKCFKNEQKAMLKGKYKVLYRKHNLPKNAEIIN